MGRVKSFLVNNKIKYIKGIIALIAINLIQITIPKIIGALIDGVQNKTINISGVFMYFSFVIIVALAIFILNYLTRLQIMGSSILFQYEIRNDMFKHIEKLSMKFFNKNGVGDIMALSVNDVTAVRMALGRGVTLIIDTFFTLILSIIIMAKTVNLKLTLVAFLPFPILIFIIISFGRVINKKFRKVQESFAKLTQKVQENISGIRVIKAFVQEKEEIENFKIINKKNYDVNMDLVKVWGIFYPLIEFISSATYLIVLLYGSYLVLNKSISLGDFIAVNSYIGILVRPIRFLGMIVNLIQRGKASMERIEKLFYEKPENDNKNSEEKNRYKKIEFKDLSFSYNDGDKQVLKNINLTLEPQKIVAVVGKIGSGKSTLINLILRLYTAKEGQLLVDGKDIEKIPLKDLRNSIGYVPQDNFLFSQNIKENIAFSDEKYSINEIKQAAEVSEVYDNIMGFPDKFDTVLGERGVNISGGQKQRISIARAIIKKPTILLLDDCLSAVDTNTEYKILSNLQPIVKNCACLIISHRISTIKNADEILVMDKGYIKERGTHNELMKIRGLYYEMYKRQQNQGKILDS